VSVFLFNFKAQFVEAIASGTKLQTIRHRRKDGRQPHAGDIAKLYTGLRTSKARLLREAPVVDCFPLNIDLAEMASRRIISNGIRLNIGEGNDFAKLDGFQDSQEMFRWFKKTYPGMDWFEGFCVRWSTRSPLQRETKP
jgi:hypothetical protein